MTTQYFDWWKFENAVSPEDCQKLISLGDEKWEGGVVGNDGVLYCMPQHAKHVLKVDPGSLRKRDGQATLRHENSCIQYVQ